MLGPWVHSPHGNHPTHQPTTVPLVIIDTREMISVSDASRLGVSKLAADAQAGRDFVIMRHNMPAAAVVGMEKLQRLRELEEREAGVAALVTAVCRLVTEADDALPLDEVQRQLGISDDEIIEPVGR